MSQLTEEQRRRIDENRQRALQLKQERQNPSVLTSRPQFQQSGIHNEKFQKSQDCYAHANKSTSLQTLPPQSKAKHCSNGPVEIIGSCVLVSPIQFEVVTRKYNEGLIRVFREMPSRNYNPQTRMWSFSLQHYEKLLNMCKTAGVHIEHLPACVLKAFDNATKGREKVQHKADINLVELPLRETLMSFQKESLQFAIQHKGRLLLADDMGLGKTLQALSIACLYKSKWPLLIVTPSSMKYAWQHQISTWLPSVQSINVVTCGRDDPCVGQVNILSYDLMVKHSKALLSKKPAIVILDESHNIKNVKTSRAQTATKIVKAADHAILLSGTPALSRPAELFTQISALQPKIFSSFHHYGMRYCAGKQQPWGFDYTGASNLSELQIVLEECVMLRRVKAQVLSELPAKTRHVVVLDPSSINQVALPSAKQLSKLREKPCHGLLLESFHQTAEAKIPAINSYIKDLITNGQKLLVFAHHQAVLDELERALLSLCGLVRIDGKTSPQNRQFLVDKFQSDENTQVALLSITAANSGLNLTAASLVVFAELFWNPGVLIQAEDRAHRLGQEDNVTIHYLIAKKTADDLLWPMIQKKLNILGAAGLSRADFSDTTVQKELTQLEKYFMEVMNDTDDVQEPSTSNQVVNSTTTNNLTASAACETNSSSGLDEREDDEQWSDIDDDVMEIAVQNIELEAPPDKKFKK